MMSACLPAIAEVPLPYIIYRHLSPIRLPPLPPALPSSDYASFIYFHHFIITFLPAFFWDIFADDAERAAARC